MLLNEDGFINTADIRIERLPLPELHDGQVEAGIMRLDKIHPVISGNKWFKLRYFLEEALERKQDFIVTFGGAYSNHIVAAACAANALGLQSAGIIRGEKPAVLSHTLLTAVHYGMKLQFVSREAYQQKDTAAFRNSLSAQFPGALFIPEGGCGPNGVKGSRDILSLSDTSGYTHILCATGTGTMYCGLANSLLPHQQLTGICVLKGLADTEIPGLQWIDQSEKQGNCRLIHDYHFGGYAKKTPELIAFMNKVYLQTGIPTDFVYTGKLLYGLYDLLKKGYFPTGEKVLVIHSGGLQGNDSLKAGVLDF